MAKRTQFYRVAAATMASLIGKAGEVIVNTSRNSLHVHDGLTPNGTETARADLTNVAGATASAAGKMTAAQVVALDAVFAPSSLARVALSGTSVDIAVPVLARRIEVFLDLASTNGTSPLMFQINSGGLKTVAYEGVGNGLIYSTGWAITVATTAASQVSGKSTFVLMRNDNAGDYQWFWNDEAIFKFNGASWSEQGPAFGMYRGLVQERLDSIRLTTIGGIDTFDGGFITARFSA